MVYVCDPVETSQPRGILQVLCPAPQISSILIISAITRGLCSSETRLLASMSTSMESCQLEEEGSPGACPSAPQM